MTFKVDFEIFDLNGKSIGDRANKFIAHILMKHKGDRLKLYELALRINKEKSIEIDTTDLKLIEVAVNENQLYDNLVSGAILKEIEFQKTIGGKKEDKTKDKE